MKKLTIKTQPLTQTEFAPFGDVIEIREDTKTDMNKGTIDRFHALAQVQTDMEPGGTAVISLAKAKSITPLPLRLKLLECHPHSSQAFYPLFDEPMLIVVAPSGDYVQIDTIRAFLTNGQQGINYHPGVWHMPMIASKTGQQWLIVDCEGPEENCDEMDLTVVQVTVTK